VNVRMAYGRAGARVYRSASRREIAKVGTKCRESREKRSPSREGQSTISRLWGGIGNPNAINSIVPSGTDASFQI